MQQIHLRIFMTELSCEANKDRDTRRKFFSFDLTIFDTWQNIKTECERKLQKTQMYLVEE
jgi:hypothetical protein